MNINDFLKEVMPSKNKLYRFALSYLKNQEEAEDVVQEVFIKVWNGKNSMQFYKSIEAWCMTLTRNLSLDRLKSKQFQSQGLENHMMNAPDRGSSPYQQTEINNTMEKVNYLIDRLPDKQREVIHLRDVEGYSYQEISGITGMELNQVKVNLFRARNKIKKELLNLENYGY